MLYAELGPAQLPFPVPVRSPRLLPGDAARPPQFAECAAIGGRTEQARPAAGSRCSCGAGGHGARTPAGAGERPGAPGRGRRERPSGNARPAAARRSRGGGVPGQPVPTAGPSEPGRGGHAGGTGWGGSTVHSAVSGCCAATSFFVKMPILPKGGNHHDHPSGDHLPENLCRD